MPRPGQALTLALRTSWQVDANRTRRVVVLSLLAAAATPMASYGLKVMVDAANQADQTRALQGALAGGGAAAMVMLAQVTVTRMTTPLRALTGRVVEQRLTELESALAPVDDQERPDYLDRLGMVQRDGQALASAGVNVAQGLALLVTGLLTAALLASVDPVLVVMPLFAVPALWAAARVERLRQAGLEGIDSDAQDGNHLFDLATSVEAAKDVHVGRLRNELLVRHRRIGEQVGWILDRLAMVDAAWAAWARLLLGLAFGGALFIVVRDVVQGVASMGDLVLVLTLLAQMNHHVGRASSAGALARTAVVARAYLWLTAYSDERAQALARPVSVPGRLSKGIELCGVGFRYPGEDKDVLIDVDLSIPAGTTLALVGRNGAGKSTIVKLICRQHQPTRGAVLVEGVDLRRTDGETWRHAVSVGLRDSPVELPSHGKGGVTSTVPPGRSLLQETLVFVLDGTTGYFDADEEPALFASYVAMGRQAGRRNGAITVLVTRGFSSAPMADLVAVVDGGRVVETGTHSELLKSGGLYAELYELEAQSYR